MSQEHSDLRRQQILGAARRCFVREGFHQTSMADIFAESGLSAGSVYGYFKSKNDIIGAIAGDVVAEIVRLLEPIMAAEPLPTWEEAIERGLVSASQVAFGDEGFGRLAPQVWAEAMRDEALRDVLGERYRRIHELIAGLVAAEQRAGRIAADRDPVDVAKVLLSVVVGYMLQRLLLGDIEPVVYARALSALARPGD